MASDDAGNQKPNSPIATHPLQVPLSLETYMREPVNIHNTEATARTAKRIENLAGITSQQVTTAAMGCTGLDVMPIDDRTDHAGRSYKFSSERRWCYSFLCRSRSRLMNVLCVCYSSVCAGFRCSEMVGRVSTCTRIHYSQHKCAFKPICCSTSWDPASLTMASVVIRSLSSVVSVSDPDRGGMWTRCTVPERWNFAES